MPLPREVGAATNCGSFAPDTRSASPRSPLAEVNMRWVSKNFVITGFLLTISPAIFGQELIVNKTGPTPGMSVFVCNYAPAAGPYLAAAKREATRIFQNVGVDFGWHDCSPAAAESRSDSSCKQVMGPRKIILRIVPAIRRAPGIADENTLGYAVANLATVSFDRVIEVSHHVATPTSWILGFAMAHEMGHLLLHFRPHPHMGIMRARWSRAALEPAAVASLNFTPEEGRIIRANVVAGMKQQVASRIVGPDAPLGFTPECAELTPGEAAARTRSQVGVQDQGTAAGD